MDDYKDKNVRVVVVGRYLFASTVYRIKRVVNLLRPVLNSTSVPSGSDERILSQLYVMMIPGTFSPNDSA